MPPLLRIKASCSGVSQAQPAAELTAEIVKVALSKGLVLVTAGPARNVIRILVPLSVTHEIIAEGMGILEDSINETLNQVS